MAIIVVTQHTFYQKTLRFPVAWFEVSKSINV
jgi:hypothetical protein